MKEGGACGSPGWGGVGGPGSAGNTQVSEVLGPAELLGIFPGRAAGSWKPSVPGKERGSGVLPRSFAGNENLGGGQDSRMQSGKMKPFHPGSCSRGCQEPNRPGLPGLPWGRVRLRGASWSPNNPGSREGSLGICHLLCPNSPWHRPVQSGVAPRVLSFLLVGWGTTAWETGRRGPRGSMSTSLWSRPKWGAQVQVHLRVSIICSARL